ncbi:MAG: phosphoribosylanthranilate isomerase [Bacteroidetes bacterium]|nr:phosphoribosylanthranilate isomerase [Bacteroidota bacterium]
MNVKVSGITNMKQLQQLDGLNVDFAGLIFYKPSPRYAVDNFDKKAIKKADLDIKTVGIFKNASYDEIMKAVEDYELDLVQFHGEESPELCEGISAELEVIKTFRIGDEDANAIDKMIKPFDEVCDYYLFDKAPKKGVGSEGKKFDWKKIGGAKIEKPFFLGGGIRPEDAALINSYKHPDFFAVDINSHFEKEPGNKDMSLILQFMHGLKQNKKL